MRNCLSAVVPAALMLALVGCTDPRYADVVRFHTDQPVSRGTIEIVPTDAGKAETLEFRSHAEAAALALQKLGFQTDTSASTVQYVATLDVQQADAPGPPARSGVSVSLGGGVGIGNNAAVGASVPLGGQSQPQTIRTTTVAVQIRGATGTTLWEGRASSSAPHDAAESSPAIAVPQLIDALFQDFPGSSGRTTRVRLN